MPSSDDGPDEEMLAAAAGQAAPVVGPQAPLKPSEAPGASPREIKVRPSSALGAYARAGPAAAGTSTVPSGKTGRSGPYAARPAAAPSFGVAAALPRSPDA
eukprot:12210988-Alexandrium_andersonii.AAC.1